MDLIKNKRRKRGADYSNPRSIGLYDLDDKGELAQYRGHVSREAAHIWLHGNEGLGRFDKLAPELAPTVDEMIEAVAAQLKAEMALYMDWALDNEDVLKRMYRASGTKPPTHVGPGAFRLTRAKW